MSDLLIVVGDITWRWKKTGLYRALTLHWNFSQQHDSSCPTLRQLCHSEDKTALEYTLVYLHVLYGEARVMKNFSQKLQNTRKTFFLNLVARLIREIYLQRDSCGLSFARNEMLITGLDLNTPRVVYLSQLIPELRKTVGWHKSVFGASKASFINKYVNAKMIWIIDTIIRNFKIEIVLFFSKARNQVQCINNVINNFRKIFQNRAI